MNINLKAIETIQFKNSLKDHCTTDTIVTIIQEKIKTIPNIEAQKYNPELMIFIASVLEKTMSDNSLKGDKMDMFLSIYKSVFEISTLDEVILRKVIEFMLCNKLIKIENKITSFLKKALSAFLKSILLKLMK